MALVAAVVGLRLHLGPYIVDDAYITFRYATNLSEGHGLVYNLGEPVLGTTAPLYAVGLAAGKALFGWLPENASFLIGVLADAAATVLVIALAELFCASQAVSLITGLLFGFSPLAIRHGLNGMETSLAVACLLAAWMAWFRRRRLIAVAIASIGCLIRPEFLAVLALLAFAWIQSERGRAATRVTIVAAVILIPWVAWSWATYGSILPSSIAAKGAQIYAWGPTDTLATFLSHFSFLFLGYPLALIAGQSWPGYAQYLGGAASWGLVAVVALAECAIAFRGGKAIGVKVREATPLLAFPCIYVTAYVVASLRHVMVFDWYLAPLLPAYLLLLAVGIDSLGSQLKHRALAPATLLLFVLCQTAGLSLRGVPLLLPSGMNVDRERAYQEVAIAFERQFSPEVVVAAPEIGALGYYTRARILDTAGLISPRALAYYPFEPEQRYSNYAVPVSLILDLAPDYLVSLDVFIRSSVLPSSAFRASYTEVYRRPTAVFGGSDLLVFRRTSHSARTRAGSCPIVSTSLDLVCDQPHELDSLQAIRPGATLRFV